jgi:hypothetical protein
VAGVTYHPQSNTRTHHVSPHTRESVHLTPADKLSHLVNIQGGAPLRCVDKEPQTIRHVSLAPGSLYPHTVQTHQHVPPSAETATPTHQAAEGATRHVSLNDRLQASPCDTRHVVLDDTVHVGLHGRRTKAVSNAAAWLPSEFQAFYWSYQVYCESLYL